MKWQLLVVLLSILLTHCSGKKLRLNVEGKKGRASLSLRERGPSVIVDRRAKQIVVVDPSTNASVLFDLKQNKGWWLTEKQLASMAENKPGEDWAERRRKRRRRKRPRRKQCMDYYWGWLWSYGSYDSSESESRTTRRPVKTTTSKVTTSTTAKVTTSTTAKVTTSTTSKVTTSTTPSYEYQYDDTTKHVQHSPNINIYLNMSININSIVVINKIMNQAGTQFVIGAVPDTALKIIFKILAQITDNIGVIMPDVSSAWVALMRVYEVLIYIIRQGKCGCSSIVDGNQEFNVDIVSFWTMGKAIDVIISQLIPGGYQIVKKIDFMQMVGQTSLEIIVSLVKSFKDKVTSIPGLEQVDSIMSVLAQISLALGSSDPLNVILAQMEVLQNPSIIKSYIDVIISYAINPLKAKLVVEYVMKQVKILTQACSGLSFSGLKLIAEKLKKIRRIKNIIKIFTTGKISSKFDVVFKLLMSVQKRISLQKTLSSVILALINLVVPTKIHYLRLLISKIPKVLDCDVILKELSTFEPTRLKDLEEDTIIGAIFLEIRASLKLIAPRLKLENVFKPPVVGDLGKDINKACKDLFENPDKGWSDRWV